MAEWTTEDVREVVIQWGDDRGTGAIAEALLDRWMDAHDAEVRAQAVLDAADALGETFAQASESRPRGILQTVDWLRARAERGEA